MRLLRITALLGLTLTFVVGCSQNPPSAPPQTLREGPAPSGATLGALAGKVFIDTDGNGLMDFSEAGFGIANVTLVITDAFFSSQRIQTDPFGNYHQSVPPGTYRIDLPLSTPEADFNEGLAVSFDATTALSALVVVPSGGASVGFSFGFKPKVEEITQKLEQDILQTNGLSVSYWQLQFILALTQANPPSFGVPNPPAPDYDAATLLGFLNQIEGMAFVHPFQFPDGGELKRALIILSNPLTTPLAGLERQLLAFELNEAAGLGIIGEPALQAALITFSESVYLNAGGASPTEKKLSLAPAGTIDDVAKTKLMLQQVNRGGGGGPVQ